MDNEKLYPKFVATLAQMSDAELEKTLQKAKILLKPQDYDALVALIQTQREADP